MRRVVPLALAALAAAAAPALAQGPVTALPPARPPAVVEVGARHRLPAPGAGQWAGRAHRAGRPLAARRPRAGPRGGHAGPARPAHRRHRGAPRPGRRRGHERRLLQLRHQLPERRPAHQRGPHPRARGQPTGAPDPAADRADRLGHPGAAGALPGDRPHRRPQVRDPRLRRDQPARAARDRDDPLHAGLRARHSRGGVGLRGERAARPARPAGAERPAHGDRGRGRRRRRHDPRPRQRGPGRHRLGGPDAGVGVPRRPAGGADARSARPAPRRPQRHRRRALARQRRRARRAAHDRLHLVAAGRPHLPLGGRPDRPGVADARHGRRAIPGQPGADRRRPGAPDDLARGRDGVRDGRGRQRPARRGHRPRDPLVGAPQPLRRRAAVLQRGHADPAPLPPVGERRPRQRQRHGGRALARGGRGHGHDRAPHRPAHQAPLAGAAGAGRREGERRPQAPGPRRRRLRRGGQVHSGRRQRRDRAAPTRDLRPHALGPDRALDDDRRRQASPGPAGRRLPPAAPRPGDGAGRLAVGQHDRDPRPQPRLPPGAPAGGLEPDARQGAGLGHRERHRRPRTPASAPPACSAPSR